MGFFLHLDLIQKAQGLKSDTHAHPFQCYLENGVHLVQNIFVVKLLCLIPYSFAGNPDFLFRPSFELALDWPISKSVLRSLHQVGANLGGMQLFTAENSNSFKCVEVTMENILE